MTLPSTFEPSGAQALAWLRDPVRRAPPAFLPSMQASEALGAWGRGGSEREAFEARAAAGDSSAARGLAFVHEAALALGGQQLAARELAALASAPLRAGARRRLLEAVEALPSPAAPAKAWSAEDALAPVVAIGRLHAHAPREVARRAAIERVGADVRGDARLEQVLDRVASVLDFPLLVVSVVSGGETVHRAFRSRLPAGDPPRAVPREASFCTHCVAGEAPLLIANARRDPFFARHPAVEAFGLVAYFGVPLRLPTGEVVGTLCGYDQRPRDLHLEDVAMLEVFARRCGEILAAGAVEVASPHLDVDSSREAGVDVYAPPFFEDVADVLRMAASTPGTSTRGAALLVGPVLDRVPDPGWGLIAGRLRDGRAAWLVAGQDVGTRAGAGAAALRARLGAPVGLALLASASVAGAPPGPASVRDWVAIAS